MPRRTRRQARSAVTSSPLKVMVPLDGRSRPEIMPTSVVLPAPLGPITALISPG